MSEIECPKCGRKIRGRGEMCLFCGTRIAKGAGGGAAREKRRKFPVWALGAGGVFILLCCVLAAQSGALMNIAAELQSSLTATTPLAPANEASSTPIPTNTPTPTSTPVPTTPTPAQTPTPDATPTPEPMPMPPGSTPTPTPATTLLPDTGRVTSWHLVLWALGGAMVLLGWGWSWLWHLSKGRRD
jgi:cell division septation protein DedD